MSVRSYDSVEKFGDRCWKQKRWSRAKMIEKGGGVSARTCNLIAGHGSKVGVLSG